jgi:hypothetical protein
MEVAIIERELRFDRLSVLVLAGSIAFYQLQNLSPLRCITYYLLRVLAILSIGNKLKDLGI